MHQSGACQAGREHGSIWLLRLHSCHVVRNVFCTALLQISRLRHRHPAQPCRGGLRFGAIAGLFCGAQQLSAVAQGERSLRDDVTAGAVAGAAFGATSELCAGPFIP